MVMESRDKFILLLKGDDKSAIRKTEDELGS